jgi:hypothetical protein
MAGLLQPDPDFASVRKLRKGDLFYGSSTQPSRKSAVLHDPPITHVDAVMRIAATGRYDVRTDWRFMRWIE